MNFAKVSPRTGIRQNIEIRNLQGLGREGDARGHNDEESKDAKKDVHFVDQHHDPDSLVQSPPHNESTKSPADVIAETVGPSQMPVEVDRLAKLPAPLRKSLRATWKLARFIGPGFMVAVAYIDPGNYSTDVSAGAQTRYQHLFVILMSNIFAVVLQALAIRLGTVTGMDLAQNCRAHLPKWLNWALYFFAESAIIATDIAEVIGTAIALNLLGNVPLVAGCAISILEVFVLLIFYRPNGSMRGLKIFEYGIIGLVLAVVVCFCIQLSLISGSTAGEVLHGYIPSSTVVNGEGIYLSCGILGATVMPHSLYLGSGVCKPRCRDFDNKLAEKGRRQRATNTAASSEATLTSTETHDDAHADKITYRPSMAAIKHCLTVSTVELVISLCIFALFVNSAILITAGASLYGSDAAADGDLFGIYDLLSSTISRGAAIIFALALLFSGLSAGVVCTIAGQMVSEGALNWTVKPWVRQLMTRTLSIIPSIIVAGAVGKDGLNAALNGSQVALSVILPFVSAPLVYFTCRNKYMTVGGSPARNAEDVQESVEPETREDKIGMRNHWIVSILAVLIWLVIVVMNVALLVFVGLGMD